jgi:hypothetical protein
VTWTLADPNDGYAVGLELAPGFGRVVSANRVHAVRGGRVSQGIRCGIAFTADNDVDAVAVPYSSCAAADRPHPFPFPYPPPPL